MSIVLIGLWSPGILNTVFVHFPNDDDKNGLCGTTLAESEQYTETQGRYLL